MNIDPIAPYAGLLKALAGLVTASVLLFGGCSWGKSIERENAANTLAKRDATITELRTLVNGAASALDDVNRQAAQEEADAAEKKREADFAKERAEIAAEDLRRKLVRSEKELAEAMRDPGCREQLEKPLCAVLR